MGLSNAFSAGIFLAAAIVHIIPESLEQFEGATKDSKIANNFPFVPVAICSSFLFVLLIDRVIFDSHSHEHGDSDEHAHNHEHQSTDNQSQATENTLNNLLLKPEEGEEKEVVFILIYF